MEFNWIDGFEIKISMQSDAVHLMANKEGLLSLANLLIKLSEGEDKNHFHLDEFNALEEGSMELIVERL